MRPHASADVMAPAGEPPGSKRETPLIQLDGISKRYGGVQALSSVSLTLQRGEVHCLCGQNGSGKSTLIKIIAGVEQPDAQSRITIDGQTETHLTPAISTRLGVQVIYQDLSLFPNLTVAENIAIGQHAGRWHRVNRNGMRETARQAMTQLGIALDPRMRVAELGIAQRQLVAICRAMAAQARIVVMDEPTASLTRHEVDALLALTRQLQERGIAVLFVSHRLDEVMEVAEQVTVLRDGVSQGCFPAAEMNDERLTTLMTGQAYGYRPRRVDHSRAPVALSTQGLSRAGEYEDITLQVRAGEILGVTGLLGAGRTELALSLFGMTRPDRGEIRVDGHAVHLAHNRDAIRHGIAYLAEDRLSLGLVVEQSIGANIIVSVLDSLTNGLGLISSRRRDAAVKRGIERLRIKTRDADNAVSTLSGGNQQRVVLAKWLATEPGVLILDSPTVGVDIGAKDGIYEVIRELAAQGMAVIMISDEIPEVLFHSDRIVVMRQGRIVSEHIAFDTRVETLEEAVHG
ncbi:sugar ABC transporter ATP-binding protein [Robbsia sp. Bb-Pol-6]|uniref:Sugar ABC transporter ATP-binding protein n=1 Tax=Robbsia betulipollinis TaxID=2981849 RepID=A0ABT3ZHN7_9BURK|nr:sugar ABC transporter ATP-binding protein [Robbsia betulipollinis]MCY0385862.1 sugar ABC transporter ATP-binding protein [Robbsia betulipollinis]